MIWSSLAEQAVYPQDREQCFRWFAEVKTHIQINLSSVHIFFKIVSD